MNSRFRASGLVASGVLVASLAAAGSPLHAQDVVATFKASVSVVPITAVVRDARNHLVRDLTRDDFQIREDGQLRPILDFRATSTGPVSVALLFDTSGSMRGATFEQAVGVAGELLDLLNHSSDEVALFTFDKTLRQETPFTTDPDLIRCAVDALSAWGMTSLYDAVAETAKQLADRSAHRRAVIVITDGADTSSALSAADVAARASAIDVPVYVIGVVPPRYHADGTLTPADAALADLAARTGGELRHVSAAEHIQRGVIGLMSELRHQYFLAIESASTTGWRQLDVRTRRQNLTVRARSGYFADGNDAAGE
jgi:VWFA-related protein